MTVEWVRVGDVLEMSREPVEPILNALYRPIGVRAFGRGIFDYPETKGGDLSKVRYFEVPPSSLVVSNIKGWEGAVAVTSSEESGRIATSRFLTYQAESGLDLSYVRHWLLSDGGMDVLDRCSPGSADRNRTLSRAAFEASVLPRPELDEQRHIASHLDSLGDLARRRGSAAAAATGWSAALRDRAVEGAGGELTSLAHLLRGRAATAVSDQETYRITGVYSFGRGLLDRGVITGDQTKYSTMTTLLDGDVVYSKLGAFEDAVAVVDESFAGTQVSPEFPVFEVVADLDPVYLRAALTTTSFHEQLMHAATGVGARQKRVSPSAFLSLQIPVPPLRRQRSVAEVLSRSSEIGRLGTRTQTLTGALLPAARNDIFNAMR